MKYTTLGKKSKTPHKKTIKKELKTLNCSPAVKGKTVKKDSCLTPPILEKIKKAYNQSHKENPILSKHPEETWDHLKDRFSCDSEMCWIDQLQDNELKSHIKKFQFAPKKPVEWKGHKEEDTWISNFDIKDVLRQYEVKYPYFILIEPTTMDFDARPKEKGGQCVLPDLCEFSLKGWLDKKKTKIAISINLAKYYEGGEHWVSLFVDIENHFIFYFDSGGDAIPMEVQVLIDRIKKQGVELEGNPIHFKVYDNKGNRHQEFNTECGMYSMFFFITMLTGKVSLKGKGIEQELPLKKRIDLFLKKKIPDRMMIQQRDLYFND